MPHIARALSCLLLTPLLCACQSLDLVSGFDSSVDFSGIKTFAWSRPKPLLVAVAEPVNPTLEEYLMRSTRTELENRGLTYVADRNTADLAVAFVLGRNQLRVGSFSETFQNTFEAEKTDFDNRTFSESQLGISMVAPDTGTLVWYGSVSKGIKGSDQLNLERTTQRMVEAILAGYPPAG